MMNFPEEGWSLPEGSIDHYVEAYGGNPFCLRLDGTKFGHDPEDPRLDLVLLKGKIQDYVRSKGFGPLKKSHTWWDSHPRRYKRVILPPLVAC